MPGARPSSSSNSSTGSSRCTPRRPYCAAHTAPPTPGRLPLPSPRPGRLQPPARSWTDLRLASAGGRRVPRPRVWRGIDLRTAVTLLGGLLAVGLSVGVWLVPNTTKVTPLRMEAGCLLPVCPRNAPRSRPLGGSWPRPRTCSARASSALSVAAARVEPTQRSRDPFEPPLAATPRALAALG